jgi:hypothetical protein
VTKISFGGKEFPVSDWNLTLNRDHIDASVFGPESKTYLTGLREASGTFSGTLDGTLDGIVIPFGDTTTSIYLYADKILPFWQAWWIRLRHLDWPTEVVAEMQSAILIKEDDGAYSYTAKVDGGHPLALHIQRDGSFRGMCRRAWRRIVR